MAKYTIKMSCGHEQEVTLFGKNSDRERKIHYFETQGLCKECYKKEMEEIAASQPFSLNIDILPYINNENGEILLFMWFDGNTKPYKDQIKEIGYTWQRKENADNLFGLKYSNKMCWAKIVDVKDIEKEVKKAKEIGVERVVSKKNLLSELAGSIAMQLHNEWEKKNSAILELHRPEKPKLIKNSKWNWKVYGRSGNQSIYLDGDKVNITDEQAEELQKYVREEEKYRKDVQLIKSGKYESAKKKEKEIEDALSKIKKPHVPEVLNGHRWNQKIYGKSGNYTIYSDNIRTEITDDQAEEIRKYLEEKETYKKKVEEIENAI